MPDTKAVAHTRRLAGALLLFSAIALAAFAPTSSAAPSPVAARVVFAGAARFYVALQDSSALHEGDRVTLRWRRRDVATGTVSRVLAHELAVVGLDSGSLVGAKKLERLKVLAERSTPATIPTLRVGYPAAHRASLLFACDHVSFVPPASPSYRSRSRDDRSERWVRERTPEMGDPWPDTLIARFFDQADDEEIALERGDLDVAIFWPGELSRHMREQSHWQDHPFGLLSGSFVGAIGLGAAGAESVAVAPDTVMLDRFSRELFRGDLLRWSATALRSRPHGPIRFEVDLASPGWREMQRFLDPFAPPTTKRHARLALVEGSIASLDSMLAHGEITPLFLLRCPVVCGAEVRPTVNAIGPGVLVDALDCRRRSGP